MAEIHQLPRKSVDQEMVEQLERLLIEAKEGRLKGVMFMTDAEAKEVAFLGSYASNLSYAYKNACLGLRELAVLTYHASLRRTPTLRLLVTAA